MVLIVEPAMRDTDRIERLIWIFVYVGLFTIGLGIAVLSAADAGGDGLSWLLIGGGIVSVVVGAALLWVRSRMGDRRRG